MLPVCAVRSFRVLSNRIFKDQVVVDDALGRVAYCTTYEASAVLFMAKVGGPIYWGKSSPTAHLAFDLACCQFEPGSDGVILTVDHNDDPIEEAIWYTLNCAQPAPPYDRVCHATIAICIDHMESAQKVENAFIDPVAFSDINGPIVDE